MGIYIGFEKGDVVFVEWGWVFFFEQIVGNVCYGVQSWIVMVVVMLWSNKSVSE